MDPKTYVDADTVYNLNENQKNKLNSHMYNVLCFCINFIRTGMIGTRRTLLS